MIRDFSFMDAIDLFQSLGFSVTPGPSLAEVTLTLDHHGGRTYCVYPARAITAMAGKVLEVRKRMSGRSQ